MSILHKLSHSHHELDLLFMDLRSDVQDMAAAPGGGQSQEHAQHLLETVEWLSSVLRAHARFEEKMVFPELRRFLGEDCERVEALERQHRALRADLDFLEAGARGVVKEGRPLDMQAVKARVEALVQAFDLHGEHEAELLDTTANMIEPVGEGAG
jgi:hypothetical protein